MTTADPSTAPGGRTIRRAVVTGGAGFLGSHLCEALLAEGVDVICLDNFLTGDPANVAHLLDHAGFELRRCDITQSVAVSGPVDLVLHFASPASPVDYANLPLETLKVGATGTWNALALAEDKGARLVLASTSEVYGDPQVHPQPESYWGHVNPIGPRAVYDEAKRYAEALTAAYRTAKGVDTAIVRIFNTYGPRLRPDDGRAIPTFIRQALAGEPLTVAGDGRQTRSLCYVEDLVRGILALARAPEHGPVNLGDPTELTVRRIAEDVIAATGSSSRIRHVARPVDDPQVRRPDTTLAHATLGWRPRVTWQDGLTRTVAWFRERRAAPA
ncbi:UDP-glucuronic acid decarboxylase family protein [Saccharothrix deserti]|uniref:UDP-glucuronic acid decarboxylase family protein n=1 Tax=Saccharothrix deserti TaxID=2593674 RepID=UPI00131C872B|nr:UDP-glucuronic acid decarboxylase family protein [Saccharothrix deserti]